MCYRPINTFLCPQRWMECANENTGKSMKTALLYAKAPFGLKWRRIMIKLSLLPQLLIILIWSISQSVSWLVGQLVGQLVGCIGWSVNELISQSFSQSVSQLLSRKFSSNNLEKLMYIVDLVLPNQYCPNKRFSDDVICGLRLLLLYIW